MGLNLPLCTFCIYIFSFLGWWILDIVLFFIDLLNVSYKVQNKDSMINVSYNVQNKDSMINVSYNVHLWYYMYLHNVS